MNRRELLNGVGKMLVTYGNGIINSVIKDGVDQETEDSIIAFRQRVREINQVHDDLMSCLRSRYGGKYVQDIKTVEGTTLILERALNQFIDNENIYVIVKMKNDNIIFDFFFKSRSTSIQDREVEFLDAKRYLVLKDLEVLGMGTFKWYSAEGQYDNDSRICRIRMEKGSDYLSKWLKEKIIASRTESSLAQLELIIP